MKTEKKPAGYRKNVILLLVILTSVVNPFLGAAVNIAIPSIATEFGMNAVSTGWIAMAFLLSSAVFLVPFGKAADIVGRKKIFLYGNLIVALSSLLCALSSSGAMLIASRVIQGMGSAMMFGTGMAIITSAFPVSERGKAIGYTVSAVYLGLSVAPFLGGLLTEYLGWRSLFIITIPFGLTVALVTILAVKTEWAEARGEKFDYGGSVVYMVAIAVLMYGFSILPDRSGIILTIPGAAGIMIFIFIELRAAYPVMNIHLFKNNRVFAFSNLAALINYAATFAISFVLSLYLQYVKGSSPKEAGVILITQPLVMMVVASFSGRMSDRYDPRILSSLGMAIITGGLVFLSFLNDATTNGYIISSLVILGTGFGLFSSPNTNSIMSSVEKKFLGVASATVGTMRLTGQMVSMGIATMVFNVLIGNAKITAANHQLFIQSTKIIFILFSILCFLGVFASLARGKHKVNNG
ncbi:MAG: MFS transporter [Bacteroidales bacterium]|nr:MFS transporter [Bacteroidales bacterium]